MKIILITLLIFLSGHSEAYDKIAELTLGNVWSPAEQFLEMGLDFEYFPEIFSDRLSLGLASEIEFEKEREFYAGPLLSLYLSQLKIFVTSGIQGHDSYWRLKSRLGTGYDLHLSNEYMLIPNVTLDFIDREVHPGVSIGVAKKF